LASANVITDWDATALAMVEPMPPIAAQRQMAMVHVAMFDAVNSIERRYAPCLVQLAAVPDTSKEAAAATAAATVLAATDSKTADKVKAIVASYLASIADGAAKSDGVRLGEAVAARVLEARKNDGADAPTVAGIVGAALGSAEIPEIAISSTSAPGVIHRWTNTRALTEEVANARIWAGFHYRFSTRAGSEMGRRIGEYVVNSMMQPARLN
jgi:hypothetical protein